MKNYLKKKKPYYLYVYFQIQLIKISALKKNKYLSFVYYLYFKNQTICLFKSTIKPT
jgi:hypothetical protein